MSSELKQLHNLLRYGIGAVIGVFLTMIAFDAREPVKLVTTECYKYVNPSMLHRTKCPKGVK